jgi:demethylmenaquinone methyltransferase/2-methoxy-6-polyprenyl-1,4-benzoquinol methylase
MSATYGLVNLISSFGFAARWRHQVVQGMPIDRATHVVDLMSGMNELCRSIGRKRHSSLHVTAFDISPEMIRRSRKDWPFQVDTQLADVLSWDFPSESADLILSSFGLKTFSREQQAEVARRVAHILVPGGSFSFVEISVPPAPFLRWPYLFYLSHVVPWIGRAFLGNPDNYRMLGFYTREFGDCRHFADCLRQEGLQVNETQYFFGCATGVRGAKPVSYRTSGSSL